MANAGNLRFSLSLDSASLQRQYAQVARTATAQGRASGAGYSSGFRASTRNLRVSPTLDTSSADRSLSGFTSRARSGFSAMGASITGVFAGIAASVAGAITSTIGSAIGSVISMVKGLATQVYEIGSAAETTRVSINTLVGNADKANKLLTQLQSLAASTPYTSGEIAKSAKILLTQVDAAKIPDTIRQIGDASSAVGARLNEVALIYAQVVAKGKYQAEEGMQFAERGIDVNAALAKSLGVSKAEVQKLASEGKITGDIFIKAFATMSDSSGQFYKGMEAQSKTLAGRISTIEDSWQRVLSVMYTKISPAIITIIEGFEKAAAKVKINGDLIERANKLIQNFTKYLAENPAIFDELIRLAVTLLEKGLLQLVKAGEQLLGYLKENPSAIKEAVEQAILFVGKLGEAAKWTKQVFDDASAIYKELDKWATAIDNALNRLGQFLNGLGEATRRGAELFGNVLNSPITGGNQGESGGVNSQPVTIYSTGGGGRARQVNSGNEVLPHHRSYRGFGGHKPVDLVLKDKNDNADNVPVPAPFAGRVTNLNQGNKGYGKYSEIVSDSGEKVRPAHFSKHMVTDGARVVAGQTVGLQGNSGESHGTHLHIEASDKVLDKFIKNSISGQWGGSLQSKAGGSKEAYERGFLNAIALGESDPRPGKGYDAVNPEAPGARGRYQFIPSTRQSVKNKYGLDAWSKNPQEQDKAALALIKDVSPRALSYIHQGKFEEASNLLDSTWVSLPTSKSHERSSKWNNRNINEFLPKGGGGFGGPVTGKVESGATTGETVDAAVQQLDTAFAERISDYQINVDQARKELESNLDQSELQTELKRTSEKYQEYRDRLASQLSEVNTAMSEASSDSEKYQLGAQQKQLSQLIALSHTYEANERKSIELAQMTEATKLAEQKVAEEREQKLQREREYTQALLEYQASMRQKGEQIKAAIAANRQAKFDKQDQFLGDQITIAGSEQAYLQSQAGVAGSVDQAAKLNRQAGAIGIQIDTAQQLHAVDQLARSGRFAATTLEQMRNRIIEMSEVRLNGLNSQFLTLGGVIGQQVQGAFGTFLNSMITGSDTVAGSFRSMINSILQSLAQLAVNSLLQNLFGGGLLGGGGGLGSVFSFAAGSQGSVGQAISREKAAKPPGSKVVLAALNTSEYVLTANQMANLTQNHIPSFAMGSGVPAINASGNSGGLTIAPVVNIQGGMQNMNPGVVADQVRKVVYDTLLKERTNSGGLLR